MIGVFQFKFVGDVEARRGCCSYHGGVCGCGCCDGTGLSSTCAPYYPECNRPQPTVKPIRPTVVPTRVPPVVMPTKRPLPTVRPTAVPTRKPIPTAKPTLVPTVEPTLVPTIIPTIEPTLVPTVTVEPEVLAVTKVNEVLKVESQNVFSRFFRWVKGKK